MFDLTTRSSNHLEFGLRSAAFGGQKHDVAFYRLGAGPLIGVKVRDNLQIQAAFLRFQESGHLKGHGHSYDSMGYLAQLGWQYCVPVFSRVTLAWGGFFSHHRGNIDQTDLGQQSAHTSLQNLNFNQGISQGIEIALRTEL
jgi:hypothetical protein